jgi:hypothetical protein
LYAKPPPAPPPLDRETLRQRELVARVATLELLVADLLHLARQVDARAVDELAAQAAQDLLAQEAHPMPCDAEDQRFRLRQVMANRARNLASRRFSSRLAVQRCEPSD